jgi:prefoldin subunit 5
MGLFESKEKYDSVVKEKTELENQLTALKTEKGNLEIKISELVTTNKDLTTAKEKAESDLQVAITAKGNAEKELATAKETIQKQEKDITRLKALPGADSALITSSTENHGGNDGEDKWDVVNKKIESTDDPVEKQKAIQELFPRKK